MERKGDFGCEFEAKSLIVPLDILEQVIQHLEAALPFEGGGLLFGRRYVTGWNVDGFEPMASRIPDPQKYEADPRGVVAAVLKAKASGLDILATVHSHPSSAAVPSSKDLTEAFGYHEMAHGIVSFKGATPDVKFYLYQKVEQAYLFYPLSMKLTNL